MEERIFTGYCRSIDCSRMVIAEAEDGVWFADCSFGSCPYEASCDIAKALRQLQQNI